MTDDEWDAFCFQFERIIKKTPMTKLKKLTDDEWMAFRHMALLYFQRMTYRAFRDFSDTNAGHAMRWVNDARLDFARVEKARQKIPKSERTGQLTERLLLPM